MHDISGPNVGFLGQFGHQKTDENCIEYPLFYLTEIHTFRSNMNTKEYTSAIITVSVNSKGEPNKKVENVELRYGKEPNVGSDVFLSDYRISNTDTIHFEGWIKISDMIESLKKKNEELFEKGKITKEQLENRNKKLENN